MKNSCMHTKIRLIRMGCLGLLIALLAVACQPALPEVQAVDEQPSIFPDYTDVTIPCNIAPLNFRLQEAAPAILSLSVGEEQLRVAASDGSFSIPLRGWRRLLAAAKGEAITVEVYVEKPEGWLRYAPFTWQVAADPIDPCLVYRKIAPGYRMWNRMGIYQRDLTNFEEEALLDNKQTNNNCMNCHSFCQQDPDRMLFHQRMTHAGTYVIRHGEIEKLDTKTDRTISALVYPYWHPKGRFCAFSTNKTLQMFHAAAKSKRIEVYDSESDIFVYDTQRHSILRDTLLMRKEWAENTPVFSPDGKWLYFITARRQNYPADYNKERYSLCRVAFDSMSGRFGTQVDTLINARTMGKSVTWPRPSYDGRYLLYTQIDYGYFSVWHPESDLWILNLKTMQTYPLTAANSKRTESLHAWTKNSKWFLFTSRRDDGLYTRIYLSSIDRQGRATKPFMLPQRHPKEYYRLLLYSYNTPDFTLRPVDSDAFKLQHDIESEHRISTQINQ